MRKLLVALGCALLTVAGCTSSNQGSVDAAAKTSDSVTSVSGAEVACPADFAAPDESVAVKKQLPDIKLDCLRANQQIQMSGQPGVPMIVNFWAAWCGPCRTEMPILQEFYTAAAGKVLVLGVVTSDSRSASTEFTVDESITFPNVLDKSAKIATNKGLVGLPNSLLIDAKGEIVYAHPGPFADKAQLREAVKEHLGVDVP